jgi:thiamine biosynthesis protein ThiS
MILHINGDARDFPDGLTVASLVENLGMKADRVAVELNLEIVARSNWGATFLKDGDKLEIVHFVGGGSGSAVGTASESESTEVQPAPIEQWTCPSCSAKSSDRFCSSCGEKKMARHDLSIGHLMGHAAETLFHWDSKIFRTFRTLLVRPGLLSQAYVNGQRKTYIHPFQVFFVSNVLYFLAYPAIHWSGLKTPLTGYLHWMWYSGWATRLATHRAAVLGISMSEFAQRFDRVLDVQSRSMVLLMVPIFAIALFVLEWRRRRYLVEHLVFSLHYIAAFLLLFMIGLSWMVTTVLRMVRFFHESHRNPIGEHSRHARARDPQLLSAVRPPQVLSGFNADGPS